VAENVSDEAFARAAQQGGVVSYDDVEAARVEQAQNAKQGRLLALAEVLIEQGIITAKQRENLEKKVLAQQAGGIMKLGQYKLLKKLGEGGMGAVYLAEDLNVGRKVAVKVLPKKHSDNQEFLTRFRREAQSTGKLNHVNIVGAHTVGEERGLHYYAMEYCDGEPLDSILRRELFIQWDLAVNVVLQVARGLKHAHEHGIIHRDIKPANIFICKPLGSGRRGDEGEVFAEGFVAKILDLGLSKTLGGGSSFYTQTGVALGTPHYISPEQANGDKNIDGRTDIYSLGATFYHLVTGEPPFHASTAMAIMLKHIKEQLPNPQDIRDEIPDGVVQVIQRMMAKAPADRYPGCKELLDDLELVIDGKMPSSQAIDEDKSSVAVARVPRASRPPAGRRDAGGTTPSRDREGAVPLADARGSESPRGTRRHEPVAERRGTGGQQTVQPAADARPSHKVLTPVQRTEPNRQEPGAERRAAGRGRRDVPLVELTPAAPSRLPLYIGASVLGLGLLAFIVVLAMNSGGSNSKLETQNPKSEIEKAPKDETANVAHEAPDETKTTAVKPEKAPEAGKMPAVQKAGGTPALPAKPEVAGGVTDAWIKMVQALPAEKQVEEVVKKLQEVNPAIFKPLEQAKIEGGKVTELSLGAPQITDISPVRALTGLKVLKLTGCRIGEISPLKGLGLSFLAIDQNSVNDISPLKGMPLVELYMHHTKIGDLRPLRGMPLVELNCTNTNISDLSPLVECPIKLLFCDFVPERDGSILRSIKTLERINGTPVAEFWKTHPETGAAKPDATGTGVWWEAESTKDTSFRTHPWLDGQGVNKSKLSGGAWLSHDGSPAPNGLFARYTVNIPETATYKFWIREYREQNPEWRFRWDEGESHLADRFRKAVDQVKLADNRSVEWWNSGIQELTKGAHKFTLEVPEPKMAAFDCFYLTTGEFEPDGGLTTFRPGADAAWTRSLQGLAPEEQVKAVVEKLKALNPGFNGNKAHKIEGGEVTELSFLTNDAKDISPVAALSGLRQLWCGGQSNTGGNLGKLMYLSPLKELKLTSLTCGFSRVHDLSPLKEMPLSRLDCRATDISDLSPLRGMRLTSLACQFGSIKDLAPIKGMPLRELGCDFVPERDAAILRSIKTLEKINDMPVAEFWKKYPGTEKPETRNPKSEERPWKPIFDGKTLECFGEMTKEAWRVENGAVTNVPGIKDIKLLTKADFGDGDVRIHFEVANCSYMHWEIYAHPGADSNRQVRLQKVDLTGMAGKPQEVIFSRQDTDISATLNGRPVALKVEGPATSKGGVALYMNDGTIRVLGIEYRELAPAQPGTTRLEVGQKDKDGWTCIFNGRDLTGWGGGNPNATIAEGAITLLPGASVQRDVTSPNFELKGAIKLISGSPGQNCGAIYFRRINGPGDPPHINLHLDGDIHLREDKQDKARSGSKKIAAWAWQQFVLRVLDASLELEVEGKPVLKGQISSRGAGHLRLYIPNDWAGASFGIKDLWLRELGPDGKPLGAAQPDAGALPKGQSGK